MKTAAAVVGAVAVVAIGVFAFYMVDIDQTQEGSMPDVNVSVEGGQLPKFDAEVGKVAVGEKDVTVDVPKVEVTTEKETVSVPTLSVTPPNNDG